MPFPEFSTDIAGNRCVYVGETHTDNTAIHALAWQMMFIHDQVDAVFIEYYPLGEEPQGNLRTRLKKLGFFDYRSTMAMDVSALRFQCQRYGIPLVGWNKPGGTFLRAGPRWNGRAALGLVSHAKKKEYRSYIIFGGALHGPLMAKRASLGDLPCFAAGDARTLIRV